MATKAEEMPPSAIYQDRRFAVLAWIGIVNQLSTTKANQLLAPIDLPFPQFLILNHIFARPHETHTVSRLASAFQQPQPGITKTVQKLSDAGYLTQKPSSKDGRVKNITISRKGAAIYRRAVDQIAPFLDWTFESWSKSDINEMFQLLDRLKELLDVERDDKLAGVG